MIVPMKKADVVVASPHWRAALKTLRKAGVLHLSRVPAGRGEAVEKLQQERAQVQQALNALDSSIKSSPKSSTLDEMGLKEGVQQILTASDEKNALLQNIANLELQRATMEPFGDFEPADLEILKSKDIELCLVEGNDGLGVSLEEAGASVFVISRSKKQRIFAAVFQGEAPSSIREMAIEFPEFGRVELDALLDESRKKLELVIENLAQHAGQKKDYEALETLLNQRIEMESLASDGESGESLSWISGFIPEDGMDSLKALAAEEGWGLLLRDPAEEDLPPTLVRNKKSIRIIAPVFEFLGTVPGYREYDISPYFLAYFSVFFAMIIGDGGYGVLFLMGALALAFMGRKKGLADAVKLLFLLSLSTVAWGAVTGNWFGSKALAAWEPLKSLTVPALATYPELFPQVQTNPQDTVMWLCFLLGLSQLTLANLMNFLRDFPSLRALSHLGWGSLVGGLYFLVLNLVLGSTLPSFAIWAMVGGFAFVLLFGEQGPGIPFLKGLGKGLGGAFTTFLDSISGFSNIISYIRLFAVGMSSFYIASSFNNLAAPMLDGWLFPAGILVVLIGHGLNLVMALLSVVVHGIRLNMLEFSGQLGMEWSGMEYDPFRVRISEENTYQGVPS